MQVTDLPRHGTHPLISSAHHCWIQLPHSQIMEKIWIKVCWWKYLKTLTQQWRRWCNLFPAINWASVYARAHHGALCRSLHMYQTRMMQSQHRRWVCVSKGREGSSQAKYNVAGHGEDVCHCSSILFLGRNNLYSSWFGNGIPQFSTLTRQSHPLVTDFPFFPLPPMCGQRGELETQRAKISGWDKNNLW